MRKFAPFAFLLLFAALLSAASAEVESPRSQLWLIAKTFGKVLVTAILVSGAILWYRRNKP
jgi:hypothetical protein